MIKYNFTLQIYNRFSFVIKIYILNQYDLYAELLRENKQNFGMKSVEEDGVDIT